MSLITQIVLVTACLLSGIIGIVHTYISVQKFRQKDEVWETALKLSVANGKYTSADDFACLYEQLKFFKSIGCELRGCHLNQLIRYKEQESGQTQSQHTEN